MVNRNGKRRHHCFAPGVRGKAFSILLLSTIFDVDAFGRLRKLTSTPSLLHFYYDWTLRLISCFFHMSSDDQMSFENFID